jgi:hypothetical protein
MSTLVARLGTSRAGCFLATIGAIADLKGVPDTPRLPLKSSGNGNCKLGVGFLKFGPNPAEVELRGSPLDVFPLGAKRTKAPHVADVVVSNDPNVQARGSKRRRYFITLGGARRAEATETASRDEIGRLQGSSIRFSTGLPTRSPLYYNKNDSAASSER